MNAEGVVVRFLSLDVASKMYVPATLRARVLYLCHDSLLVSYSGKRCMYDSMRKELYWSEKPNDVYTTARDFPSCAKNRIDGKRQWQL